jgi:hypothetical protein
MAKKKIKRARRTKTKLKLLVAFRTPSGEIDILEFSSSEKAYEFLNEAKVNGCEVLLGWGES